MKKHSRQLLLCAFILFRHGIFAQEAKLPYPIIFVHGILSNDQTWQKNGAFNDAFDYLAGAGLNYGGPINITLDYKRSLIPAENTKDLDVHLYSTKLLPADYYAINFNVHATGRVLNDIHGFLTENSYVTSVIPILPSDEKIHVSIPAMFSSDDIIRIDDEIMMVNGVGDDFITVKRNLSGTQSSIIISGETIWNLSNESNQSAIAKQGYGIKEAVEMVKSINHTDKVILVGHSMGGLAIREYLRTYNPNNIAKIVTIGTPHLGSNIDDLGEAILWLPFKGLDNRSDGMRDLRYKYSSISEDPKPPYGDYPDNGVFLFGGSETSVPQRMGYNYYSRDVNANGLENDEIIGLNANINNMPANIAYTWIVSQLDNIGPDLIDGDICVQFLRQFPWNEYDEKNEPIIAIGDTVYTNKLHHEESTDAEKIIRGIDEPGDCNLAYEIMPGLTYTGTITHQPNYNPKDIDSYKIETTIPSKFTATFWGSSSGIDSIVLRDKAFDKISSGTLTDNKLINVDLNAQETYYFIVYGTATSLSWRYPYYFKYQLTPNYLQADFSVNVTNGLAPLTVNFTNLSIGPSGKTYEWDFKNDGTATSNAVNPEYTYTSAGTYSVKLTVNDGVETKARVKENLIIVTNDIATSTKLAVAEYYFDSDPGVGSATRISIPNVSDYQLDARLNIGALPDGIHLLGCRVKDASGNWSFTYTKLFIKEGISSQQDKVIAAAEYFFDQDPGIGNGKKLQASMSSDVSIYSVIDVSSLANGIHTLTIRVQDGGGRWSILHSQLFLRETRPHTEIVTIAKAEYFFDQDPGYSMGIPIPVTEAASVDNSYSLDLTTIPNGLHNLFVRVQDSYNKWSNVYSKAFIKESYHGAPNLKRIEYFVDHDPGLGNATSAGTNFSDQDSISVTADLSNVSPGIHVFFCRAQDADNKWSYLFSKLFLSESGNKSSLITSLEYFFDTDPGWGKGTPVAVNAAGDLDVQFNADLRTVPSGQHQLFIRAKDNNGVWGWVNKKDFEKVGISIPLRKNWNLISWNIDTPVDSTQSLFARISGQLTSVLSFEGSELSYNPAALPGLNTLKLADHRHAYWLQMKDTSLLNLSGPTVDKQSPLMLKTGYNLVSYLPEKADSVTSALSGIMGNLTVVMGFDAGGLTFDPNIPPEFNTLRVLSPGFGYWIKSKSPDTLIYPATGVMSVTMTADSQGLANNRQLNARIIPSREWMSLWGNNIMLNGQLFPKGTQMTAKTPKGVICGSAAAWADGKFGLMPIYKDDSSTVEVEGAAQAEEIELTIGEYIVPKTIRWTENGLVIDLAKVITGVREMSAMPREYALSQNYPNPFNPSTTIEYGLPAKSAVRLVIYNVLGQIVKELVNGEQTAGWQSVVWNANVASGLYLYRLEAVSIPTPSKRFVQTKKLLLLR